jgi:hypothetical protein
MNDKSTPEWQMTTPAPARQTSPIAKKSHIGLDPLTLIAPHRQQNLPTNLINIIQAMKQTSPPKPTSPEFSFELTAKAAK